MVAHRKGIPLAPLLLVACVTTSAPDAPPRIIPPSTLERFCGNIITEYGPVFDRKITIPFETVPLIEIFALHMLSTTNNLTAEDFFADDKLSQELLRSFTPTPIAPPKVPSNCHWRRTTSIREAQGRNDLVLELSSPLENPYATDTTRKFGVFARLTSGVIGGTWYWISIEKKDDEWKAVNVIRLDISEH